MAEEKTVTLMQAHQYFGAECNNRTWDLIERTDRSDEETVEMIHEVHASCWHWSKVGEQVNLIRGHYLVAKVYFAAGMREMGAFWAQKTWAQTQELGLDGWDYAFGLEIAARGAAAGGRKAEFETLHREAEEAIAALGDADRQLCQAELDRGPWFGMK